MKKTEVKFMTHENSEREKFATYLPRFRTTRTQILIFVAHIQLCSIVPKSPEYTCTPPFECNSFGQRDIAARYLDLCQSEIKEIEKN